MLYSKSELQDAIRTRQTDRERGIGEIKERLEKLEAEEGGEWEKIRGLSFNKLVATLQSGDFKPTTVLHAYQQQSIKAHEKTNCATQFLPEAEKWAKILELKYADQTKPPLYGMPFSIKEQLELTDHDSTFGFAQRINNPIYNEDAVCIETLRNAGAIPFVRTNTPQGLVSFNSSNPIYGRTTHPLGVNLTPGGSSGGEAALLAMGGAPFGLGTDGGGSIRIPSGFSGICGIKPTMSRVSQLGVGVNLPGTVLIGLTFGPMAQEVDALVTVFRHSLNPAISLRDPYVSVTPFKEELYNDTRPLTIGYYDSDGWFESVPAMQRGVKLAKEALEANGHTLVPFKPPSIEKAAALFTHAFMPDGGTCLLSWANKDIVDDLMVDMYRLLWIPVWLKRVAAFVLDPFYHRIASMARAFSNSSSELRQVYEDIGDYRRNFVNVWNEMHLDCVLAPAFAHPAPTHELTAKCHATAPYTALYNLLDFPAGVVSPITKVTEADEQECKSTYPEYDMYAKLVKQSFCQGTVGLPVGVQCVALPNQDELCLRLMKEIEEIFRGGE